MVLVVPTKSLGEFVNQEFIKVDEIDVSELIFNHGEWKKKSKIEKNHNYKRLIPFAVLIDKNGNLFTYKTSLLGINNLMSIGIGGGCIEDNLNNDNKLNCVNDNIRDDVKERLNIEIYDEQIEYIGLINANNDKLFQNYLGILCYVKDLDIQIDENLSKIDDQKLESFQDIKNKKDQFEYWSQVVITLMEQYIEDQYVQERTYFKDYFRCSNYKDTDIKHVRKKIEKLDDGLKMKSIQFLAMTRLNFLFLNKLKNKKNGKTNFSNQQASELQLDIYQYVSNLVYGFRLFDLFAEDQTEIEDAKGNKIPLTDKKKAEIVSNTVTSTLMDSYFQIVRDQREKQVLDAHTKN